MHKSKMSIFTKVLVSVVFSFVLVSAVFAQTTGGQINLFPRNLTVGSQGVDVLNLQKLLNSDTGTALSATAGSPGSPSHETSSFGALTREAVIRFQTQYNVIPADGVVATTTRTELNTLASLLGYAGLILNSNTTPVVTNTNTQPTGQAVSFSGLFGTRILILGSQGEDVRALQQVLNRNSSTALSVYPGAPGSPGHETATFGPATQDAVVRFQMAYGLSPIDGTVNTATAIQLNQILSGTNSQPVQQQTQSPYVDVRVDGSNGPIYVTTGTTVTITWTSFGVTSCVGGSGTSRGTSGSIALVVNAQSTQTLTCTGNGVSVSDSVQINVSANPDTIFPTLISKTPANTSTGVSASANIVMGFSEAVVLNTGGYVDIKNANTSALIERVNTTSAITISGSTVTVNPVNNLPAGATVYIEIPSGAFRDVSGNAFSGISGNTTWRFTVSSTANTNLFSNQSSTDPSGPSSAMDARGLRVVRGDIAEGPGGIRCADRSFDTFNGNYIDSIRIANGVAPSASYFGPGIRLVAEDPATVLATTTKLYMIVDVSSGIASSSSTSTFPVTFLDDAPEDLLSNDAYKTVKIVLRKIPAGTFTMGSPENEPGRRTYTTVVPFVSQQARNDNDEILHSVTLAKPFYTSVFEITQKQYERVTGTYHLGKKQNLQGATQQLTDAHPVLSLTWDMARGGTWPGGTPTSLFMTNLKNKTGRIAFDLPTEARWEYVCRAGTNTGLNSGKQLEVSAGIDALNLYPSANADEVSIRYNLNQQPNWGVVGQRSPNTWGIYDMHGNVGEWTLDWSNSTSTLATTTVATSTLATTTPVEEGGEMVPFGGTVIKVDECTPRNTYEGKLWQVVIVPCNGPLSQNGYVVIRENHQQVPEVGDVILGNGVDDGGLECTNALSGEYLGTVSGAMGSSRGYGSCYSPGQINTALQFIRASGGATPAINRAYGL